MKDAAVVSERGEGAITSDVFFVFDKGQISQQGEQFAQPAFHGTPHTFDEFRHLGGVCILQAVVMSQSGIVTY